MAKPVMMLAAAALAAAQSSEDYVMHAANVSGPFGGVCELCGELVCVPHLNFASVSAMVQVPHSARRCSVAAASST